MEVRRYSPEMHKEVSRWWEAYAGWSALPMEILPDLGFMACSDNGDLLSAGFLYHDQTSTLAMMEWIVSNPANTPRESVSSINALVKAISEYADENKLHLFTTLQIPRLADLYAKHGFVTGDTGMTNMTRLHQWH